jgi:hypothetical protein
MAFLLSRGMIVVYDTSPTTIMLQESLRSKHGFGSCSEELYGMAMRGGYGFYAIPEVLQAEVFVSGA